MKSIEREKSHWTHEAHVQRMLVKDWQQILLNHDDVIFVFGHMRHLKSRSIGSGVVEVYKEPFK